MNTGRVPGHGLVRPAEEACLCGEAFTGTKRARRAAYGKHLAEARADHRTLCRACSADLPAERQTAGLRLCVRCATGKSRAWRSANRERYDLRRREHHFQEKYGISVEDYDRLFHEQDGRCATCGAEEADARGYQLHVDHRHSDGKVRGLLCGHCNRAVGLLRDDPEIVRRLAAYLEAAR